jgi:hypothetical protein
MLFSAEKGVTNGGTIVHYKGQAKGKRQYRKEQLFTTRERKRQR